jgi:hypothetical protein
MKFQFGTRALLLATAYVAVACGGWIGTLKMDAGYPSEAVRQVLGMIAIYCPFWLPFVFLGFAVGRRALTARAVTVFALSEAAAVGLTCFLVHHPKWWMG